MKITITYHAYNGLPTETETVAVQAGKDGEMATRAMIAATKSGKIKAMGRIATFTDETGREIVGSF